MVATRHAGIPDVVSDGETGLLVEERDVSGMAARMLRLARQPDLAMTLGRAARRRIESHFSIGLSIGRLLSILQACAGGRHLLRTPGTVTPSFTAPISRCLPEMTPRLTMQDKGFGNETR